MSKSRVAEEVVRLLRGHGAFVSGEGISLKLGISRAAVWKSIEALRSRGFEIQAVPSRGYRLLQSPDLSREEILAGVKGDFWNKVLTFDTVDSTNDHASRLVASGKAGPGTVVLAEAQEKGKGRLGRHWISPAGSNIYMSLILFPEMPPIDFPFLTIVPALACAEALGVESALPVAIKWPNDLVINGRKIGGILAETKTDPDRIQLAIIGIGLNINLPAGQFPGELRHTATSLFAEAGRVFSRSAIVVRVLREFERLFGLVRGPERSLILSEWKTRSSTLGREVTVLTPSEEVAGLAEDFDERGMLTVRLASGETRRITAGDVTLRKTRGR